MVGLIISVCYSDIVIRQYATVQRSGQRPIPAHKIRPEPRPARWPGPPGSSPPPTVPRPWCGRRRPKCFAKSATSTSPTDRSDTFTRPCGDLPEQERHPDALDRAGELDDAVEVVRRDAPAVHRARRHGDPGQPDLRLHHQGLQRLGQQPVPSLRDVGVDLEVDLLRDRRPISSRSAATRSTRGRVLLKRKPPVSVSTATYSARAALTGMRPSIRLGELTTSSPVALACGST